MKKEPSYWEKYMADSDRMLDEIEQETTPAGFDGKRLPSVSIQPRTAIFAEFLTDPVHRGKDKYGRDMWWSDIVLLAETDQGFFEKKRTTVKAGENASINLGRHLALLKGAQANAPLKGKRFCIANLGKRPTAKGNTASDYRWKPLPEDD